MQVCFRKNNKKMCGIHILIIIHNFEWFFIQTLIE